MHFVLTCRISIRRVKRSIGCLTCSLAVLKIYILLLRRSMNVFIYSVMSFIHLIGHAYIFQELGYIWKYQKFPGSPGRLIRFRYDEVCPERLVIDVVSLHNNGGNALAPGLAGQCFRLQHRAIEYVPNDIIVSFIVC